MGVPSWCTSPFRDYDFSSSSEVSAVVSKAGKWVGFKAMESAGGMCGLAKTVARMGAGEGKGKWTVEAAGSSLGKYPSTWLSQIFAVSGVTRPYR